jgi:hypothetical protein
MIELMQILVGCSIIMVCACTYIVLTHKRTPEMRVVLPGDPMNRPDMASPIPWHNARLPRDATHIAWIMHGNGHIGRVHTLYMQSLENLAHEVIRAKSPWGPIITHSIELECDIRDRGCVPDGEIMYAVARIDGDGNEYWLGKRGDWVNRWDVDASIYDVFGADSHR